MLSRGSSGSHNAQVCRAPGMDMRALGASRQKSMSLTSREHPAEIPQAEQWVHRINDSRIGLFCQLCSALELNLPIVRCLNDALTQTLADRDRCFDCKSMGFLSGRAVRGSLAPARSRFSELAWRGDPRDVADDPVHSTGRTSGYTSDPSQT